MKGATPALATSHPFSRAPLRQTARVIRMQEQRADNGQRRRSRSPCVSRYPATIPPSPATDPTERSMPPVRTTNVMPMARIAEMATCLERIARLFVVRNDGVNEEKRTRRATSTKPARARSTKRSARTDVCASAAGKRRGRWRMSYGLNSRDGMRWAATTGLAAPKSASSVISFRRTRRRVVLGRGRARGLPACEFLQSRMK